MPNLASATILLAHGSSDPRWLEPFALLHGHIQKTLPNGRIELAFMELAEPSLATQVNSLVQDGHHQIDVMPLFFAAGRHLRHDVPLQLDNLQQQFLERGINVSIRLHDPVGMEAEVMNAITQVVARTLGR